MIFNRTTLSGMRKTQESTMCHVCRVEPYIVAGDGTVSYGKAFKTKCGFKLSSGYSSDSGMYETVEATAEIRFPLGVRIGMKDRVTILESFGTKLAAPRVFEVSRLPGSFGPSGQVVQASEVYA